MSSSDRNYLDIEVIIWRGKPVSIDSSFYAQPDEILITNDLIFTLFLIELLISLHYID